ncbi:hypothetical protein B0T20DRAFT_365347 [Sordaria brevicollis]|uniref:Uncharacterized protein n=1 Tax=Sordaria brevicollis TaxID=83679 RepID=A0AAE0NV96_SORBR|nr:hypothetical protein B0T20DRAFT_365347 [Sordaria brevicollis]
MPEIARSREPYPLDKLLAEIDTDQLLSVVTYPPEWYLRNVLSATEEAAGWARRLWGWGCETADEEECSGLKMGSEFLTTAMGSMGVGDVEAATGDMEAQPPPPASLESLPHEIFTQICEQYPDDPEVARSSAAWMELRLGMGQYRKLVYSRDEYLQHFRWCRLAQERWEAAVRNRDLRTGELVVPEEYETETLENTESAGW